mmetsp:Transcript_31375/g.69544  ORF Transcript_31375/g.69544 Transcript_31375/m.69544 type:complete len:127 (-) Transcript_31375:1013-1393(-)
MSVKVVAPVGGRRRRRSNREQSQDDQKSSQQSKTTQVAATRMRSSTISKTGGQQGMGSNEEKDSVSIDTNKIHVTTQEQVRRHVVKGAKVTATAVVAVAFCAAAPILYVFLPPARDASVHDRSKRR